MFDKRKEKKAASAQDEQQRRDDFIADLNRKTEEAAVQEDPVARIQAYDAVRDAANAEIDKMKDAASHKANNSAIFGGMGGAGAALGVAGALAPLTGGASLIVGVLPMALAQAAGMGVAEQRSQKKSDAKNGDYLQNLQDLCNSLDERVTATLEGNVEQILDSPRYKEIEEDGRLSSRFKEATLKHFVEVREAQKEAAKAAPAPTEAPAVETLAEEAPAPKPAFHDHSAFTSLNSGIVQPKGPKGP